jgi:predicted alpha-1,2-mannosidase
MFALAIIALMSAALANAHGSAHASAVDQVDPLIGTAADGQTFPAAGVPFGMTQWTPQTRAGEEKCVAPYYYADTRIQGFRGSHFMSGSCTKDYGSVTIMPESGDLKLNPSERSSAFTHSEEKALPYRYAVTLTDYGIAAQLTGATRSGIMQFRFGRGGKAWILVQNNNSHAGDGTITINPARGEIEGVNPVRRLYAGSGKLAGFNGYFVVRFDRPFQVGGTWSGNASRPGSRMQGGEGGAPGAYVGFDLRPGDLVRVKVGTSFTSIEEARRNLDAEISDWDYQRVEDQARAAWSAVLDKVQIREQDAAKRRTFYSAMYHSMLLPRVFSDVSGTYPGFAGEGKIETVHDSVYYEDFSLWDTFRALHPLLTIVDPDRERDMVRSLILKGQQGGFLPIYPAWNSYTSEMIGDHAGAVIVDAYAKGIRGYDIEEAYRLMRKNATQEPDSYAEYVDGKGRRALASYLKYGFVPLEDPVAEAFHKGEQVSRTLEYAYDDFLAGQLAQALNHKEDAALFAKRAQNYRNVIDPSTGFARGRHADGSWDSPFDPSVPYGYITEGLPYQYTFFVPQDVDGLIALVGGRKAFSWKLDTLFARGYYNHGNEPSHHLAYLYDFAGEAWKTQMHVRKLLESQYADRPDGLAGNDDCGQISAWYVMSALGFYQVTPGIPVYQIGTPLFDEAVIHLAGDRQFSIRAAGASDGKQYIRSATLNGKPLNRAWLTHQEIVSGGELVLEMSSEPSSDWPLQRP